jgi:hypothetical protein
VPEISTTKRTSPGSTRITQALFVAGKGLVISLAKVAYALWLEVTGLVFGVFTVWGVSTLVRQYHADQFANRGRLVGTILVTLMCAWFTVVSYVRARKTTRG